MDDQKYRQSSNTDIINNDTINGFPLKHKKSKEVIINLRRHSISIR